MAVLALTTRLAKELIVREEQISSVIEMIDGGATVPFIARYRKEATGGLDDIQLRKLEERLIYMRELDARRATILKSIGEQDKLTDALRKSIEDTDSKSIIEDLYLPYKPKRRTKAQIAREAGLEPLANDLFAIPTLNPDVEAVKYIDAEKKIDDVKMALDGARQILVERFAEDAALVGKLRDFIWNEGRLTSTLVKGKEAAAAKFADYFEYEEAVKKVPSHRALAIFRGRKEEFLQASIVVGDPTDRTTPHPCEMKIALHFGIKNEGRAGDQWLQDTARWAWRVKLSLYIELELMRRLWDDAEEEAIKVFAHNLRDLLLAAPGGSRPTIALDPGFRSGVKVAVVDATGKLMETATVYPHQPQKQWDQSLAVIAALCERFKVELIAIGNGTASRETEQLAADLQKRNPTLNVTSVMVSEAGASVYSASEFASKEMPDVDVSLRGAASIGRRLQDPLAELVKIDPKSIGVGQYQHDLSEFKLNRMLDTVVEDCVNAVGVDLNMASAPLLARVAGVGPVLAENIVAYRDANGPFLNRKALKAVPRLGEKAFEQCAGFLKVMEGDNPLDRSTVHPETYPVVKNILKSTGTTIKLLMGDSVTLRGLAANDYITEKFGPLTVQDIFTELEKPGRDPRPEFKTATFQEGVNEVKDLKVGMKLEGVVTNVANFGAFVDVGVHQDGLVHVSALADKFVKDPREIVKPGDVVQVKVMEIDIARKRISLSMRMGDEPDTAGKNAPTPVSQNKIAPKKNMKHTSGPKGGGGEKTAGSLQNNAFAAAFAAAQTKKK